MRPVTWASSGRVKVDESGLPSRREKDASEAGKDGPVEEMGSKARV